MKTLGDPNCPHCGGVGYVRYDVPLGHEKFGKLESCVRAQRMWLKGALAFVCDEQPEPLESFDSLKTFNASGNDRAKFMSAQDRENCISRLKFAKTLRVPKGWLLLEGGYGCGKTHLAAAIANFAVNKARPLVHHRA